MEKIILNYSKFLLFVFMIISLSGCLATGSSTVTGNVRPSIDPTTVKLYLEPPQEYETIGIVESQSDVELSSQAARDRTIKELKAQAAKIGANGVLITGTGSQGSFWEGETKTANGKAIFVTKD